MKINQSSLTPLFFLLILLALFLTAYFIHDNIPSVIHFIQSLGILAPILFILVYCLLTLLFIPTLPLVLASGALFGIFYGTLLSVVSATISASCGFLISRYVGLNWMSAKKKNRIDLFLSQLEGHGWKSVAVFRLLPFVPFNLVNYGFGLTKITLRSYVITTFIFLIPYKIAVNYGGHTVSDHQEIFQHLGLPYTQNQLK